MAVDDSTDSPRVRRDAKGRLLPGSVLNPLGPAAPKTLTQALREHIDPDEWARKVRARMKRSDAILMYVGNRLEGMPRQALEHSGPDEGPIELKWDDGEKA